MQVRNVDKNNDWCFGHGQSDYVRDAYAVVLDIKLKLQEWYRDCFFALQNGIDWSTRLGARNQKDLLDQDVVKVAESVEGVLAIFGFNSFTNGRSYRCDFQVYQQYSTEFLPVNFNSEELING